MRTLARRAAPRLLVGVIRRTRSRVDFFVEPDPERPGVVQFGLMLNGVRRYPLAFLMTPFAARSLADRLHEIADEVEAEAE